MRTLQLKSMCIIPIRTGDVNGTGWILPALGEKSSGAASSGTAPRSHRYFTLLPDAASGGVSQSSPFFMARRRTVPSTMM